MTHFNHNKTFIELQNNSNSYMNLVNCLFAMGRDECSKIDIVKDDCTEPNHLMSYLLETGNIFSRAIEI